MKDLGTSKSLRQFLVSAFHNYLLTAIHLCSTYILTTSKPHYAPNSQFEKSRLLCNCLFLVENYLAAANLNFLAVIANL